MEDEDEATWISGLRGLGSLLDEVEDEIENLGCNVEFDVEDIMKSTAHAAFRLGIVFSQLSIVDKVGSENDCKLESREAVLKLAENLRQRVDEYMLRLGLEQKEEE